MSDYVIVGAGVYGAATAYHLAKNNAGSVTVLEMDSAASGASGGLGKRGVRANRRDPRELPLAVEAHELWPTLSEELGADTGFERTGGISLMGGVARHSYRGLQSAQPTANIQNAFGATSEVWGRDQVREAFPHVADDVEGGLYCSLDGMASHESTTEAYAAKAQELGVEFKYNTSVARCEIKDGKVTAVITDADEVIPADKGVLLSANGGVNPILRNSNLETLPMWENILQGVFLTSSNEHGFPMLTAHDDRPLSVKILDKDVIMLSGAWHGAFDPETGQAGPVEANVQGNIDTLKQTFPGLEGLEIQDTDVTRSESISADRVPFVGFIQENLMVATAWTGHGWAISPAVSRHLATSLQDNKMNELLRPFDPVRVGYRRQQV